MSLSCPEWLTDHVVSVCRSVYYHLRQIRPVILTVEAAKTLVHTFITSRLNYCNAAHEAGHSYSELYKLHYSCKSDAVKIYGKAWHNCTKAHNTC